MAEDLSPLAIVARAANDVAAGRRVDFAAVRAELVRFADQTRALEHELDLAEDDRAWAAGVWTAVAERLSVAVDCLESGDLAGAKNAMRRAMGMDA